MLNKQNLHIHTNFADGKDTPEEIVVEAIGRGFDSIGFSEHSYMSFSSYPYQMRVEETPSYIAEVMRLKEKYKGQIDIFCGMEQEYYSDLPTQSFDYVIGSAHYLDFHGKILGFDGGSKETAEYIRDNFDGDGLAFARAYFDTVCRIPSKLRVDILGHFDLLAKNNEALKFIDESSKAYLDMGREVIHALKGKIPLFEVNTGCIPRGYRSRPYPAPEFLKEFHSCGYGVVITSDCHDKNALDAHYEEAEQLIAAAGFRSKWILTDKGFVEVEL